MKILFGKGDSAFHPMGAYTPMTDHGHEQHSCENLLVMCIDFRFVYDSIMWAERVLGHKNYDLSASPGTQLNFVKDNLAEAAMRAVSISEKLHEMKRVVILSHRDCGAYGGSKTFIDQQSENEKYRADQRLAQAAIAQSWLHLKFMFAMIELDGSVTVFE